MASYDADYVKKLINDSQVLLNRSKYKQRQNKELCRDCKERTALDGHVRCEICQPIHLKKVEMNRANRLLQRENKPDMMYDDNGKMVYVHRNVMEKHLGRPLEPHEAVWWRNGDRKDNRPENLVLGTKAGFPLDELVCPHCSEKYYIHP